MPRIYKANIDRMEEFTVLVGDLSTLFSIMDRITKQKINETEG